jgi:hypothetical protein
MRSLRSFSSILLSLGLAASAFAYSSQGQSDDKHGRSDKQDQNDKNDKKDKNEKHGKSGKSGNQQQHAQQQQAQNEHARQRRVTPAPVQAQQQSRPPGWDKGKKTGWNGGNVPPGQQNRVARDRQEQLIAEQRQRDAAYRQRLTQQQVLAQRYSQQMQQDRRMNAYRFQQAYLARMRQQQATMQRTYNYNNDPYYYTANTYRYDRDGRSYETNQYGANALKQAVNNGYAEGFRAGQADRQDRYSSGYQNSYAYQDANYGYDGRYNDQDSYNYYFRQGFTKGYDDGYNSRAQYGNYSNGNGSILGNILGTILNLQQTR